ncbi:hypothetical protein HMPREF9065_00909 [Aggregatibacter sp. oral taxon 458 str. W10330]|nr:hypothetical protein HMPREF9065_00909 [Aggregatibacter sp. oral taxon 458 str. W10330]
MRKIHIHEENNETVSYTKMSCALMFRKRKLRHRLNKSVHPFC